MDVPAAPSLLCTICNERLENTYFVKCPSSTTHKFCFTCSKQFIQQQWQSINISCPSGEMCPAGNQWTFQPHEIEHILKDDYIQFMMQRERHGIPSSAPAT